LRRRPPSSAFPLPSLPSVAGTVAVVFGVADGLAVALAGALLFAAFGHWEPGQIAALALWPAMVGAAGLFARRVDQHRKTLRRLLVTNENEKRSLGAHAARPERTDAALMTLGGRKDDTDQARSSSCRQSRSCVRWRST
jgi:hypothetical protein